MALNILCTSHQKSLPWAGKKKIDFECTFQEIQGEAVQSECPAFNLTPGNSVAGSVTISLWLSPSETFLVCLLGVLKAYSP